MKQVYAKVAAFREIKRLIPFKVAAKLYHIWNIVVLFF